MENSFCPNYTMCKLINSDSLLINKKQADQYLCKYCRVGRDKWSICKRYVTKNVLSFCPDFVLPDTTLSIEQIIDKFDEEDNNH